jgi:LPPG:FO 2-phospho-L-lactate transferase
LVVVLAGGTGGAKLARGMLDVVGTGGIAVVANTGDDVELYGVHVSPDPDLVTYWLAGAIDERGWGLRGDTWKVMEALEAAGTPAWFRLGDGDLAMCLLRTAALRAGARLTEAQAVVARALGVEAPVLPMSDDPVRTWVRTPGGWRGFQEFMIVDRSEPAIEEVALRGVDEARPTPEVLEAVAAAEAIVIGPSNPIISIGPILAVPGMREAIAGAGVPVVAVSPFVGGRALKGPTEAFMRHAGLPLDARAPAELYGDIVDGIVADEDVSGTAVPVRSADTLMDDADARRRVASLTLDFADALRS